MPHAESGRGRKGEKKKGKVAAGGKSKSGKGKEEQRHNLHSHLPGKGMEGVGLCCVVLLDFHETPPFRPRARPRTDPRREAKGFKKGMGRRTGHYTLGQLSAGGSRSEEKKRS